MFSRSLLAAPALLLAAAPAFAGGFTPAVVAPEPAAPVVVATPVVTRTDGDWTGPYVGGSLSYGDLSSGDVTPEDLLDGNGALTGLHLGYTYDFGRIVVGGELENEWSSISLDNADTDLDRVARAKLRLGYDAGRVLPYITAGWARATTSGAVDDDFDGRFAGIGAEYRLNERFTTGVEILRHQFEDTPSAGVDLDATTVSLRGTFRF